MDDIILDYTRLERDVQQSGKPRVHKLNDYYTHIIMKSTLLHSPEDGLSEYRVQYTQAGHISLSLDCWSPLPVASDPADSCSFPESSGLWWLFGTPLADLLLSLS